MILYTADEYRCMASAAFKAHSCGGEGAQNLQGAANEWKCLLKIYFKKFRLITVLRYHDGPPEKCWDRRVANTTLRMAVIYSEYQIKSNQIKFIR